MAQGLEIKETPPAPSGAPCTALMYTHMLNEALFQLPVSGLAGGRDLAGVAQPLPGRN